MFAFDNGQNQCHSLDHYWHHNDSNYSASRSYGGAKLEVIFNDFPEQQKDCLHVPVNHTYRGSKKNPYDWR